MKRETSGVRHSFFPVFRDGLAAFYRACSSPILWLNLKLVWEVWPAKLMRVDHILKICVPFFQLSNPFGGDVLLGLPLAM